MSSSVLFSCGIETFPSRPIPDDLAKLFHDHGVEVRDRPFELNIDRYLQLQRENRLVWVVAREGINGKAIGYSCHFWYYDIHWKDDKVASDDMWYIDPQYRSQGVGLHIKLVGHQQLKQRGVLRVYDLIRESYKHPKLMEEIGFKIWGIRWVKDL